MANEVWEEIYDRSGDARLHAQDHADFRQYATVSRESGESILASESVTRM